MGHECVWTENDYGNYDTGCQLGFAVSFADGMTYCQYCGGGIIIKDCYSDPEGAPPPQGNQSGREYKQEKEK